jgi:hypothetical protein
MIVMIELSEKAKSPATSYSSPDSLAITTI